MQCKVIFFVFISFHFCYKLRQCAIQMLCPQMQGEFLNWSSCYLFKIPQDANLKQNGYIRLKEYIFYIIKKSVYSSN